MLEVEGLQTILYLIVFKSLMVLYNLNNLNIFFLKYFHLWKHITNLLFFNKKGVLCDGVNWIKFYVVAFTTQTNKST